MLNKCWRVLGVALATVGLTVGVGVAPAAALTAPDGNHATYTRADSCTAKYGDLRGKFKLWAKGNSVKFVRLATNTTDSTRSVEHEFYVKGPGGKVYKKWVRIRKPRAIGGSVVKIKKNFRVKPDSTFHYRPEWDQRIGRDKRCWASARQYR